MVIGQHGSWNRSTLSGYWVVHVPFEDGRPIGPPRDILTGFLAPDERHFGRPVGVALGPNKSLLVADDTGDVVWRVTGAYRQTEALSALADPWSRHREGAKRRGDPRVAGRPASSGLLRFARNDDRGPSPRRSRRVHPRLALLYSAHSSTLLALRRAVVPAAEQLVQRHEPVAVVHLEIFVVEVVAIGVAVEGALAPRLDLIEPDVADNRAEPRVMQLIDR